MVALTVFTIEVALTLTLITWLRVASRGEPPPWSFIIRLLLYGGICAVVAAFVELRYTFTLRELQSLFPAASPQVNHALFGLNYFAVALIEETGKYFVAILTIVNTRHLHRISDAIIYLVIIGLGFSLIEDAFYLLNPTIDAPYRLLSFYLHSGTSAIIGYCLGKYSFGLGSYRQVAEGLLAAIALHLSYNLVTTLSDRHAAFELTVLITLFITIQIFTLFRQALIEEYCLERSNHPPKRQRLLNI